jgi:hypothetical protein
VLTFAAAEDYVRRVEPSDCFKTTFRADLSTLRVVLKAFLAPHFVQVAHAYSWKRSLFQFKLVDLEGLQVLLGLLKVGLKTLKVGILDLLFCQVKVVPITAIKPY